MFIEETFSYLGNIVSLGNLMAMLLGVCIGLVIGAIPGLSPPMAIALLIPVSFEFEPATALILLVSCFAAGIYGGSFSAILLRTPGTSASAASAIEGYELTKKGKAVEAIKVSTFASVMGGIISGFVLLFLSRPLAQVSLWFGPAEYFLIALLGLTAIASVSFGSVSKGLISGLLGLALSTVGVDHFSSYPRFTFDLIGLQAGIGIMPAIIGLFAFAQGLDLCAGEAHGNISGLKTLSWRIWPKLSEMYQIKWSLVRGWACGLVVGIIPAAGGSIAQWIAYAWEIRRAKPGDQFGKGEIKGLAATEGSNNGVTGTSLIPMFVLGIPGGISAAVILGALTIHGLQPGLRLFKNNPEVIYTIMWGFIGANVIMAFVAIIMARTFAYLTLVPRGILGPLIILFSVVGVYAGSNNVYDIWLMIGFGVLGYFMEKYNFSTAGVLLGLVLGPIAEDGLRNLLIISDDAPIGFIMGRPVSLVIVLCIAVILSFSLFRKSKQEPLLKGEDYR
jgi:putative tricarboxylic transport membrane protein